MKTTHGLGTGCRIFAIHLAAVLGCAQTVQTEGGSISGTKPELWAFRGLPYAAPPVGELRWKPPAPVLPWRGVRPAGRYGAACIQPEGLSAKLGVDVGPISEDCLYLNVWSPSLHATARLPVIVWIHGGAYLSGAGGADLYDGARLASQGVVFVSFNYRLMQLGFFAHPALAAENEGFANFGLLDQIAALRWVRNNIAAFGGDAGNVTIAGQSAGAKSIMALFASPLAQGLFHRGVALSNYGLPDATQDEAREAAISAASALGLRGAEASLAELRNVPASRFGALNGKGQFTGPVPIRGDRVLPVSVEEAFEKGQEAALPLIVGNTSDDGSVAFDFGIDPSQLLDRMRGSRFALKFLYPKVKDDRELARQSARDMVFTLAARWAADRHSRRAPVYRYYFDFVAQDKRDRFPHGVPHGGDIEYFLNTGGFEGEDRAQARRVSDFLIAFAKTGRPDGLDGPDGLVPWRRHDGKEDWALLIAEKIGMVKNFWRPRLNAMINGARVLEFFVKR
jgi:para-nitrobenzyl esterase